MARHQDEADIDILVEALRAGTGLRMDHRRNFESNAAPSVVDPKGFMWKAAPEIRTLSDVQRALRSAWEGLNLQTKSPGTFYAPARLTSSRIALARRRANPVWPDTITQHCHYW